MKKWIALILCLLMLGLCACGKTQESDTTKDNHTTEGAKDNTTGEQTQKSQLELAKSCIDKPVDALYALIGQPESSDYAPSCLTEGGEDGNLYYADFIVYTLRTGDTEIVKDVE